MKHFAFEIKSGSFNDTTGEFEGFASVYGNEDFYGEVVDPGAFKRTLDHKNYTTPLLWQHDSTCPIGVAKYADSPVGLRVMGSINLAVEKGREAYALLKQKAINGLSIGFETVQDAMDGAVRHLKEVSLWETSVCTFPANTEAIVTAVKSAGEFEADLTSVIGWVAVHGDKKRTVNPEILEKAISALTSLRAKAIPATDPAPDGHSAVPGAVAEPDHDAEELKALVVEFRKTISDRR